MAALYLHQALFASDTPSPPSAARTSSALEHQLSFSSVTVRTSTSEHSHPTEPLLHGSYLQAAAYQDILARQPVYSEASRTSWTTGLSLAGDPVTPRERRREWERQVRRKLRRLRWARRVSKGVIAMWATYNTVRYFVAFTIYTTRDRQIALLALGTAAALSLASSMLSFLLSLFASRLGWKHRSRSAYTRFQVLLSYSASLLIIGPALANVVFVIVWQNSPNPGLSIQGRCHWDIDVLWTGTGFECDVKHSISWGAWLAGSIIRLLLTAVVVITHHALSYSYLVTRVPPRRTRGRRHSHSISRNSVRPQSSRSVVTMVSTAAAPVSARPAPQQQFSSSESDFTHESGFSSASSPGPRKLRRPRSRMSADRVSSDGQPRSLWPLGADRSRISSDGHSPAPRSAAELETPSETSHAEKYFSQQDGGSFRYGTLTGAGSSSSPPEMLPVVAVPRAAELSRPFAPEQDVEHFAERFRALVEQVSHETDAGLELIEDDHFDDADLSFPFPRDSPESVGDDTDYVPVMGKIIQRMPTIESLGSREVMSLASAGRGDRSVHTLSRPPTRANTLTMSEAAGSPSVSRSNSLTASIVLASPTEALAGPVCDTTNGSSGSRSTASY